MPPSHALPGLPVMSGRGPPMHVNARTSAKLPSTGRPTYGLPARPRMYRRALLACAILDQWEAVPRAGTDECTSDMFLCEYRPPPSYGWASAWRGFKILKRRSRFHRNKELFSCRHQHKGIVNRVKNVVLNSSFNTISHDGFSPRSQVLYLTPPSLKAVIICENEYVELCESLRALNYATGIAIPRTMKTSHRTKSCVDHSAAVISREVGQSRGIW
jgi:hypothetical protein